MTEEADSITNISLYRKRLEEASDFRGVWEIVKDSVKTVLDQYRVSMMLFLDDLPLRMGAYHQVGTNNIVMNRVLLEVVEAATDNRVLANAFVYIILLHEYLHALGYIREADARALVREVAREAFGLDHVVDQLAILGPWSILKGIPLDLVQGPKRVMEVVKGFERASQDYIV